MQEDIKILEKLRKELGLSADGNKIKQGQALEHLIKAYKEEEADLYSANSIISEQIDIINNSVSKDKIINLINSNGIEVYTRDYGNIGVVDIDSLEELLEGDE